MIMELKKGDKIKALIDRPNAGSVKAGEIGIFQKKVGVEYIVDFPSQKNYYIPTPLNTSMYSLVQESEVHDSKLVCYKGDDTDATGVKIIKILESLGGKNIYCLRASTYKYYYINKDNEITWDDKLRSGYTLLTIPEDLKINTSETPINTYGLHIGMELNRDDINNWQKEGKHYYSKYLKCWVGPNIGEFNSDRTIKDFKIIDGVIGFLVSHTADVYLKAEGFLDFVTKGEKEFVLPKKWCVCPRTESNLQVIKDYFNKWSNYKITYPDNTYTCDGIYEPELKLALSAGYTEISFEEFLKYVVKKNPKKEELLEVKEEKSLVGRYAKYTHNVSTPLSIAYWTKDKYYKILQGTKWKPGCVLIEDDKNECLLEISFHNFELMPEGFQPPSEILDKQIKDIKPPTKKEYPKVAFKGRPGVLEKLESLGGFNKYCHTCGSSFYYYYIDDSGIIKCQDLNHLPEGYTIKVSLSDTSCSVQQETPKPIQPSELVLKRKKKKLLDTTLERIK